MNPPTDQSSREQETPTVHRVHAERSYDQRAKAIIAFNTCTGDLDDKLEAAWLATLKEAKVSLPPTPITAEEAGREGEAKDAAPHWATCESRGSWVRNSLKARIGDLRDGEKMCRRAYKQEYMGEPTKWYADALGEAAAVLERRLATLLPSAPAQSGGQGNG